MCIIWILNVDVLVKSTIIWKTCRKGGNVKIFKKNIIYNEAPQKKKEKIMRKSLSLYAHNEYKEGMFFFTYSKNIFLSENYRKV